MTIEARFNLQRGVPEDKRFPATDYTSDGSFLDNYILEKARIHRKLNARLAEQRKKQEEAHAQKEFEKEVEKQAEEFVEKTLTDLFKDFKFD